MNHAVFTTIFGGREANSVRSVLKLTRSNQLMHFRGGVVRACWHCSFDRTSHPWQSIIMTSYSTELSNGVARACAYNEGLRFRFYGLWSLVILPRLLDSPFGHDPRHNFVIHFLHRCSSIPYFAFTRLLLLSWHFSGWPECNLHTAFHLDYFMRMGFDHSSILLLYIVLLIVFSRLPLRAQIFHLSFAKNQKPKACKV